MALWWLYDGGAEVSPPPGPYAAGADAFAPGQVLLTLILPGGGGERPLRLWDDLKAEQVEFGWESISFTLADEDPALDAEYTVAAGTFTVRDQPALCAVRVTYRGRVFAEGVIVNATDEDEDAGGTTLDDVPITWAIDCIGYTEWGATGRDVKTSSNVRFSVANVLCDNALRDLMREQMQAGFYQQPPFYDLAGVGRDDFGPLTYTIAAAGLHPDTETLLRWDTGDSLIDAISEYCRRRDLKIVAARTGDSIDLAVTYPATGDDLSASVIFSRARGTVRKFRRSRDYLRESNIVQVQGKGAHARQALGHALNEDSIELLGMRETGEAWHSATEDDADGHADSIVQSTAGAYLSYDVKVNEGKGCVWGDDFLLSDKVSAVCERRGVTVADYVSKLTLTKQNPDPAELEIHIGRQPVNEDQASQRSGGGGGGGKRKGGKPKPKQGEALSWDRMVGSDETEIVADNVQDLIEWADESGLAIIYAESGAEDDPTDEEQGEEWILRIRGRAFTGCRPCNSYVRLRKPNGTIIELLAFDPDGGDDPATIPPAG